MFGETLGGQFVRVREPRPDDVGWFRNWLNDPEVTRWIPMLDGPPKSARAARIWMEEIEKDDSRIFWSVEIPRGVLIGCISLHIADPFDENGQITLWLGNRFYWGRRYGRNAIRTVSEFAFWQGFHRVFAQIDVDNQRALKAFERIGYKEEGHLREYRSLTPEGPKKEGVLMSILSTEYVALPRLPEE